MRVFSETCSKYLQRYTNLQKSRYMVGVWYGGFYGASSRSVFHLEQTRVEIICEHNARSFRVNPVLFPYIGKNNSGFGDLHSEVSVEIASRLARPTKRSGATVS